MRRPALVQRERISLLTPKQKEMLALAVKAGWCSSVEPSIAATVWSVRTGPSGGTVRDFHQASGDTLVRRGLIVLTDKHLGERVVIRRYQPTQSVIAALAARRAMA